MTTPMTAEIAERLVASFSVLKFLPGDRSARMEIADLLMDLCGSAEEAIWLRGRVRANWNEWQGPAALRELFREIGRPADEGAGDSELNALPPLRFEVVTGYDKWGNPREGVRLLAGAEPLALPPAPVDSEVVAECTALVKRIESLACPIPRPTAADLVPLAPYKGCAKCAGSGWLILDEIRCECTFRPPVEPIRMPGNRQLEAEFAGAAVNFAMALSEAPHESKRDRELKAALENAPRKSKQQIAAEIAELEAALGYRDPKRGGGNYRETVPGAEPYLVQ